MELYHIQIFPKCYQICKDNLILSTQLWGFWICTTMSVFFSNSKYRQDVWFEDNFKSYGFNSLGLIYLWQCLQLCQLDDSLPCFLWAQRCGCFYICNADYSIWMQNLWIEFSKTIMSMQCNKMCVCFWLGGRMFLSTFLPTANSLHILKQGP